MNKLLTRRIVLSVLSGIGVGLIQTYEDSFDFPGGALTYYALSGFVFAAGVLLPYVKQDNRFLLRMLVLVLASSASYYSAVWLALDGPFADVNSLLSFTIASVAGAAIVMTALVLITTVRASGVLALLGLAAGLVGGPVTFATLPEDKLLVLSGHAAWHVLICVAIYYGTRTADRSALIE
jgi:hypothetical protein